MHKDNPVFIVGAARSGTTLLYETLAKHPAFSYITGFQNIRYLNAYKRKKYGLKACYTVTLNQLRYGPKRILDKIRLNTTPGIPSEGNGLWLHHLPYWKHVTEKDVNARSRAYFYNEISQFPRTFLNKNPHHCYRVRYLKEIWPHARFVHIIREPCAVVLSELKHRNIAGWDEAPVKQFVGSQYITGKPLHNLAKEWQLMVNYANEVKPYELSYEELVSDPQQTLRDLCEFLGVGFMPEIVPKVRDMNYKAKSELSNEQLTEIVSALT